MVAVAVVCFVVAVALGIALVRTRTRVSDLEVALRTTIGERDALDSQLAAAREDVASAVQARDDATARVRRTRRDAADVAARLRDESAARVEAETALATTTSRCQELERELDEARTEIGARVTELEEIRARPAGGAEASTGERDGTTSLLWELALGRAERTWRTSVSLGLDEPSPLATSANPLRSAIEIEIDAAREEAGADIDLEWRGDDPVPASAAVVILALVESVVAAVAKTAATTTLGVTVTGDVAEVRFDAVDDDGAPIVVDLPGSDPDAPGRVVVPVAGTDVRR